MNALVCMTNASGAGHAQQAARCRDLFDALPEAIEIEVSFAEPFDFVKAQEQFGTRPFFSQQAAGEFSLRLCVAAIRAFQGGADRVVLIGSDWPPLTPEQVSHTFRILQDTPVVIGPAGNSGCYLLGMNRIVPELFGDLPWSTDRWLAETLSRLNDAQQAYAFLPVLNDTDSLENREKHPHT